MNKVYYALLVPQNGVKLMVTVTTADGKKRTQTLGTADLSRVRTAAWSATCSRPTSR
ncbi:MAG: hypothetical protein ACLRMJ_06870 [Alistipes finegoldii]